MIIGIFNRYTIYNHNNAIFKPESYSIGKGLEIPFVKLKNKLESYGHSLNTTDLFPLDQFEAILFFDYPKEKDFEPFLSIDAKKYLIILESELILPDNWDKKKHNYFDKVFTWSNKLVDNNKYFKIYWPNPIPELIIENRKEGFCTLIAGNKYSEDKRELYTERVKTIKWFEKNHPEDFILFGFGWNTVIYSFRKFLRLTLRIPYFKRIIKKMLKNKGRRSPSYAGLVQDKLETISRFKFCICYENAKMIPDYITEKIFDCFFSGTVPVYLGAPNVTDFIPSDIFIDRRNFRTIKDLYSYMRGMSEEEYNQYLKLTKKFLKSEKMQIFSADYFVDQILKVIL